MKATIQRLLVVAILFSGCGKDKDKPRDYAAEISGKELSGMLDAKGVFCDIPFSIQFAANGKLTFHYFEGSFPGRYSIVPGKDSLHADVGNGTLRFRLSLQNIRTPTTVIFPDQPDNTGQVSLNENPLRQVEYTSWAGHFFRCTGGAPGYYELKFGAGNDVWPDFIYTVPFPATHFTRQGASFRYSYTLAGVKRTEYLVVMPDNTIAGIQIAGGAVIGNFSLDRKP